ncbi:MAG: hypothetical protein GY951_06135 [Psychromonas sp.]|nr:hypothetical protein [Psychromonas sp.]
MEEWQQLMRQGNQEYDLQKWHEALGYYHHAIALLEQSVATESHDSQQVIQGWICGYHNVASTYEQQGLIEHSRDTLITPFSIMLALSYHPQTTSNMKLIADHALNITLPPLLEFANKHPSEHSFINNIVDKLNSCDQLSHSQH